MEQTDSPVIIGIGELLWDMLPAGKRVGGAPGNFVYHATKQGGRCCVISAIGNDALGEELLKELNENGVGHCLTRSPYPTGTVQVTLKDGIPSYNIVEDVAWDHIQVCEEAIELMKKADAVCFGTLALRGEESRKTLETLLSYLPEKALIFFDANLRPPHYSRSMIESSLSKSDIFKLNDEELQILIPMFDLPKTEKEACRELVKRYDLRYLILTAGGKYSSVYTKHRVSTIPSLKVEVVDTVGAGDAFSSAFVYHILVGNPLQHAHFMAIKTAAEVVSHSGAWALPVRGTARSGITSSGQGY